jgi:deaminated glutathione amidase
MADMSAKLKARNPKGSEMHATGRGLYISCGVAILLALASLCNAQTVERSSPSPWGTLQVATCQFPVSGDIQANADFIRRQMREARQQGAELVHFPECALSGYGGEDFKSWAGFDWDVLHKETDSILALAKELGVWVALGSSHRLSGDHKPHNSLYVINAQGKIVDRYDKRFCTQKDLQFYSPGDHFVTFEINGVKCGLLICYDIRFPELYRQYAKLGVQLMLHSFYNARQKPDGIHPKIMPPTAQAYAGVNHMFISLNNASAEHSWQSRFITPDGLVAAELPLDQPGVMVNLVDTGKKFYDASGPFRLDCINGKLNSGETVDDPQSKERTGY